MRSFCQILASYVGLSTIGGLNLVTPVRDWLKQQWQNGQLSGVLIVWILGLCMFGIYLETIIRGLRHPAPPDDRSE